MANTANVNAEVVVAKEAIVVNVDGRPAEYATITVKNRRTGIEETIFDTDNPPIVEEDVGTAYAFAQGQRVRADHPAVLACPNGFRPIDATDALIYGTSVAAG